MRYLVCLLMLMLLVSMPTMVSATISGEAFPIPEVLNPGEDVDMEDVDIVDSVPVPEPEEEEPAWKDNLVDLLTPDGTSAYWNIRQSKLEGGLFKDVLSWREAVYLSLGWVGELEQLEDGRVSLDLNADLAKTISLVPELSFMLPDPISLGLFAGIDFEEEAFVYGLGAYWRF